MKRKDLLIVTWFAAVFFVEIQIINSSSLEANDTCHPACQSCYGQSALECYQCASSRYGNECVETCPEGTFAMETPLSSTQMSQTRDALFSVQKLNNSPQIEHPGNETIMNGTYDFTPDSTVVCVHCHSECLGGCSGNTSADCHRCKNVVFRGNCVAGCPSEFSFADPEYPYICRQCHEQCRDGCTGESPRQCRQCKNFRTLDGHCVPSCPTGTFASQGTCYPCHKECIGCHGNSSYHCTRCKHVQHGSQCLYACPEHTTRNEGDECVHNDDNDNEDEEDGGNSSHHNSGAIITVVLLFIVLVVMAVLAIVFREKVKKKLCNSHEVDEAGRSERFVGVTGIQNQSFVLNNQLVAESRHQVGNGEVRIEIQDGEVEKVRSGHIMAAKNLAQQTEMIAVNSADGAAVETGSPPSVMHPICHGPSCAAEAGEGPSVVPRRKRTKRGDNCRSISDVLEIGYTEPMCHAEDNSDTGLDLYHPNIDGQVKTAQTTDVDRYNSFSTLPTDLSRVLKRGSFAAEIKLFGRASVHDSGYYTEAGSQSSNRQSFLSEDEQFLSVHATKRKPSTDTSDRRKSSLLPADSEDGPSESGPLSGYVCVYKDEPVSEREELCQPALRQKNEPYYPYESQFCPLKWTPVQRWEDFKFQNADVHDLLNTSYFKTHNFIVGRFNTHGGHLLLTEHNVNLYIPPKAIPGEEEWEIYMHVTPGNGDGVVSPVIECGPSRRFQRHLILSFPHCAEDVKNWDIGMEYAEDSFGDSPRWQMLPSDQDSTMFFSENVCYLYINHFSRFRLVGRALPPRSNEPRRRWMPKVLARSPRGDGSTIEEGLRGQICEHCSCPLRGKRKLLMVFRCREQCVVTYRVYILDDVQSVKQSIESDELRRWGGQPLPEPPQTMTIIWRNNVQLEMKMTAADLEGSIRPEKHVLPLDHVWSAQSVHASFKLDVDQCRGRRVGCVIEVSWDGRRVSIPVSECTHRDNGSQDAQVQRPPSAEQTPFSIFIDLQPELQRHSQHPAIIPRHLFSQVCLLLDNGKSDTPAPSWRHLAERLELPTECIQWIENQRHGGSASRVLGFWESLMVRKQPAIGSLQALDHLWDILKDIGLDKNLIQRRSSDSGVSGVSMAPYFVDDL